jgi:transposase
MAIENLEDKINKILPILNEKQRRLYVASEAVLLGPSGVSIISGISGMSRTTITKGIEELDEAHIDDVRIRKIGAGRPALTNTDLTLLDDLHKLLDGSTRGDPEEFIRWTNKSTRTLAKALEKMGHQISHVKVSQLMKSEGFSLRGNKKVVEGNQHADRDEQFKYINETCKIAIKHGNPVLSVDTKKKELIGNYKNSGRVWMPPDKDELVNVHDFPDPLMPKAIPYGIYDIGKNSGFVNVGTDHDTSTFAVNSIKGWWNQQGKRKYPNCQKIVVTADCGGSNGYRSRLWKVELQNLANFIGVPVQVCHFPPGTSKWNKVEHRLFSFISSNWRGQPLRDFETVVNLIGHTITSTGLKVRCRLDHRKYALGKKVTDEQINALNLVRENFHGEWNYTLYNQQSQI